MRFFFLLSILLSSTAFASFENCRLRAIDGDPPRYINVCKTPLGEMKLGDYLRYLDQIFNAPSEVVIDEQAFLPESDYPSRPSEIDPAQLSESLRQIAELGRVSDSEQMLRAREREETFDSIEERVRRINESRDWLSRERDSQGQLDRVHQLRSHLRSPDPVKRVGIASLMEAQSSKKEFKGEYGAGHRALKDKLRLVGAEEIKSYRLVGSSAQTFLRSEKEYESGDKEFASELLSLSESLLDVGLGLAPGSSLVKDTYELIFGTNMVTGAELSGVDRGIALVGVGVGIASFGAAGGVATTLLKSKRLVKIADHFGSVSAKFLKTSKSVFDQAVVAGEKIVDGARKLGLKTSEEIKDFADLSKRIIGSEIVEVGDISKVIKGKMTRYSPIKKGPLSDIPTGSGNTVADTFRSSSYFEIVLEEPLKVYRVYGGEAGELGSYWSRVKPTGPGQATLDAALLPNFRNSAQKIAEVTIPTGTKIFEGVASPQVIRSAGYNIKIGELLGNGSQVYIDTMIDKKTWNFVSRGFFE